MKRILNDFGLNKYSDYIYFILFTWIMIFSAFNQTLNQISLYLIIPLLFIHTLFCREFKWLLQRRYIFVFLLFFVFLFFTGIIALNKELYFDAAKRYLGVVVFILSVLLLLRQDLNRIRFFFLLYILKFICLYFYADSHSLYNFNIETERASIEGVNANSFGYYAFFAILSCFFLFFKVERKMSKIILCFLLVFIIYASYHLLMIVASRAGFIFSGAALTIGIFCLFYSFNKMNLIFVSVGFVLLCFVFVPRVVSSMENSMLYKRFDRNLAEDGRVSLFEEAFNIAKGSPVIGNGLGQYRIFGQAAMSHSSYTEALFEGGLIALFLYLWIIVEPLFLYYKKSGVIKNDKNKSFLLFCVLSLSLYLLYNFFYVFYIGIELFLFFYLIRTQLVDRLSF